VAFVYPRAVRLRIGLVTVLLLLALPAVAQAAEVSLTLASPAGVRLGSATNMTGRVTHADAPLPGRTVVLEVKRHPYEGPWRRSGISDVTDSEGRFAFSRRFNRNHRVRARVVDVPYSADLFSPRREAFVLPAFTLSFEERPRSRVHLRQVYRVPRDVKLSAPTRFYLGPCNIDGNRCTARFAKLRAEAKTKRLRAGRYVAQATVRLPKSFQGRFQYLSCFRYSPGSGMGDPDQTCPRRFARVG
jgi:hypothetical protein